MGDIIPLKQNLKFLVKTEWKRFASALGFGGFDQTSEGEKLLYEELISLLELFNKDFTGGIGVYISYKKDYAPLKKLGLIEIDYGASCGINSEGVKILDIYRKHIGEKTSDDEREDLYKLAAHLTNHLKY